MNEGTVTQIIGPVIDVEFEVGKLPELRNALQVKKDPSQVKEGDRDEITVEVALHLGESTVRTVAMEQLAYPESKVSIVVNRHQTNDVLKVRDLEKSFGRPVHWRLPNDYKVAIDAITRGKPLVMGAPRSKLAQSMDRLAMTLNNSEGNDGSSALGNRMRRLLLKGQRG